MKKEIQNKSVPFFYLQICFRKICGKKKGLKDEIEIKDLVPVCVEAYIKEHGLYSCREVK